MRAPDGGGLRSSEAVDGGVSLVLNNTLDAVEDGRRALMAYFEQHALDTQAIHRLEVIFEELVSNTVRHGFRDEDPHSIRVAVALTDDTIELTMEDDGAPFNLLGSSDPARFTSLDDARLGGLGIPLVKRLSKSVRYSSPGRIEGGITVRNRLEVSISGD